MKALQLTEPKNWQRIEVEEPSSPGPDEALVRVYSVGVCGTDLGGYLGKFPFFSYPRIPGHELGVEVLAVGENIKHVQPGDRCAVEPYINCQKCYSCQRGFTNCCEHHQTLGVMCDGGLTDKFLLPGRKLHPAPQLTSEQCALVETLAIGCHAVDRGAATEKDTCLILGAGPIGLSALEFARLAGSRVIVADLNPQRLQFVRDKMNVEHTLQIQGDEKDIQQLEQMTDGQLADLVIDATGNHHSMVRALEFASFHGRVVYVGITQQSLTFPHAPYFHRRELTLLASRNALSRDFTRIIDLISDKKIDTQPWITHRLEFEEVPSRFPELLVPNTDIVKAVIKVNEG
ncbi:Zinc-type alcohol dehydrogenase [Planctomycetales bacterium 10988]|nr:Zinc-type alcohol dehydrogenase [Planctomycetales bacterium 10988]